MIVQADIPTRHCSGAKSVVGGEISVGQVNFGAKCPNKLKRFCI